MVLYIHPDPHSLSSSSHPLQLPQGLSPYHCRVLEVDDLGQAELLARVWKPNVVVLGRSLIDPRTYIQELNQHVYLCSLPLITLTSDITEAANEIPGLSVFPYLEEADTGMTEAERYSALMQVIQIAAGVTCSPHILMMHGGNSNQPQTAVAIENNLDGIGSPETELKEWLGVSQHYLHTAGFRCSISTSWSDVAHHLQHQSVDLLFICASGHWENLQQNLFELLQPLEFPPPILLWNSTNTHGASSHPRLPNELEAIATKILPTTLSLQDLLYEIRVALK